MSFLEAFALLRINFIDENVANNDISISNMPKTTNKQSPQARRNTQRITRAHSAWNDVFDSSTTSTLLNKEYVSVSRPTLNTNSQYVTNCVFEFITSSSPGGALYFKGSSQESKLFIEQSLFTEVRSYDFCGAIYFDDNSHCVLAKVCGYKCNTISNGNCQFDAVYTSDALTYKNEVNDSSIVYTFNSDSGAYYTLCHDYGRIIVNSVNFSRNYCSCVSCIRCEPSKSTQTQSCDPSCLISLSTFTNNTAHTRFMCIELQEYACKEIRQSNVIRNTQPTNVDRGIIYSCGNLNIISSCILENVAKYILYAYGCSIKVINSTTEVSITTYGFITFEYRAKTSFINKLYHTRGLHCHAEFDSVSGLTANPFGGLSLKRRSTIDMLGYLTYVLIILLLPTNPAN